MSKLEEISTSTQAQLAKKPWTKSLTASILTSPISPQQPQMMKKE
jgi:hypothetical protein